MRPRYTKETAQQLPIFLGGDVEGKRRAHAVIYLEERSIFVNLDEGQPVIIGRSSEADVTVEHSTVSRRHIELTWVNERLSVKDFGSTNGTFVNGQPITGEVTLQGGEELRVGDVLIIVGLTSPPTMARSILGELAFQRRLSQEILRASRLGRPLVLIHLIHREGDETIKQLLESIVKSLPGHAMMGTLSVDSHEIIISDSKESTITEALEPMMLGEAAQNIKIGLAEFPRHGRDLNELRRRAVEAAEARQKRMGKEVPTPTKISGPVAVDPVTKRLFSLVDRVAKSDVTTLIIGETGVGKDVVARQIHRRSRRSKGPYIHVNCGAVPSTIFAREMFGNERGAYTGAQEKSIGLFEAAHGGTLFLDEVSEIPIMEQARLLRVLEHRIVIRVGGVKEIPIDIRVISASNRDLDDMVAQGLFREDLLYRLNIISLFVPALRDRPEDIGPLVRHFFEELKTSFNRPELLLPEESIEVLTRHSWPGNVRELRNIVERGILLADGNVVTEKCFLDILYGSSLASVDYDQELDLKTLTEEIERFAIRRALESTEQNQSLAAGKLGISRRTLIYKMKRYGIPGRGWKS